MQEKSEGKVSKAALSDKPTSQSKLSILEIKKLLNRCFIAETLLFVCICHCFCLVSLTVMFI